MMMGPNGPEDEPETLGRHVGRHTYSAGCYSDPRCTEVEEIQPVPPLDGWVTKDSGQRQDYASGMRRDLQDGKPRFGLIFPKGISYEDQLLTRFAGLLERGAAKYGVNNWQLADSEEELDRFRESGLRHMVQWACGETDEDHATAVIFNLMAWENTKRKLEAGDAS